MDFTQSACVCVAIQFENSSQYCEINLTNLTRESFFNDGIYFKFISDYNLKIFSESIIPFLVVSIVPEAVTSAKVEIFIYDDRNVLVPMDLLRSVILQRINKKKFHLKIIRGEWHPSKTKEKFSCNVPEDQVYLRIENIFRRVETKN